MIVDSVKGFEKYRGLHEKFGKVYDYIRKNDLHAMQPGEYEIDGPGVRCRIEQQEARSFDDIKLEVHDVYIDIHILLEGNETIGFRDRGKCVGAAMTYDEGKDIAFPEEAPEVYVNLDPDNLVICFPSDAHAPLLGNGTIKKAIIKVKVGK